MQILELEAVVKPKCALECNEGIEGVAYVVVILFCTYVTYLGNNETIWKREKENLEDYRLELAEELLDSLVLTSCTICWGSSKKGMSLRLQTEALAHVYRRIPWTEEKKKNPRACKVHTAHKKTA
jgi:hypothetical protein